MSLALSLSLLLALGCKNQDDTDDTDGSNDVQIGPYDATVKWTSYGIPHITAADHGSLGYGMGSKVDQTSLPQTVAAFHSLVGLAAVFTGLGDF